MLVFEVIPEEDMCDVCDAEMPKPPVLLDLLSVLVVESAVVEAALVDVDVAEVGPAVMVTGSDTSSLWSRTVVMVPGALAPVP